MKNNRIISATATSMLCIGGILSLTSSARATITTTYDNTIAPFSGISGNTDGGWTTATSSGLAMSFRAQYNNTAGAFAIENANSLSGSQLTPNDGAGTFNFATGTATRAVWNFWFDVNPGATSITGDTFTLTITSSLGGSPVSFAANDPGLGNAVNGTEFQNAEDIGFGFIGFDTSLLATYQFNLTAEDSNGDILDSVNMTVNNGASPVPEPTTVVAGALLLLPFGAGALRALRKNRAA